VKSIAAGLAICLLALAIPCGFAQAARATGAGSFGLLVETDSFTVADLGVLYYPRTSLAVGSGLYLGWSNQNDPQVDTQLVISPFLQYHFLTREALTLYGGGFVDLDWQRSAIAAADSSLSAVELRLGAMAGLEWYPVELVSLGVRYRGYLRVHWDVSSSAGTSTSTSDTYFFLAPYPEFVLTFPLPPASSTAAEPAAEGELRPAVAQAPPASGPRETNEERELRRLRRRIDEQAYLEWLIASGLELREPEAPVRERIEILRSYLHRLDSVVARGSAIDAAASYCPAYSYGVELSGQPWQEGEGWFAGATFSYSYQFNNWVSAGLSLHNALTITQERRYDSFGSLISDDMRASFSVWIAPLLIVGDKTRSLAGLLAAGIGLTGDYGVIPFRLGLYFRNIYLGYSGEFSPSQPMLYSAVEAGYSLFLGSRRN
jgi:hypothetical protein